MLTHVDVPPSSIDFGHSSRAIDTTTLGGVHVYRPMCALLARVALVYKPINKEVGLEALEQDLGSRLFLKNIDDLIKRSLIIFTICK